jgi:formyl-CoA transferase
LFDQRFAAHDLAHWRPLLDGAGITFGLIGTLADIPDDAQMRHAGALVPSDHGPGWTVANPVRLDSATQRPPGAAPRLGQHSLEVLREAGFSADEITQLINRQVLGSAAAVPPPAPAPPPALENPR